MKDFHSIELQASELWDMIEGTIKEQYPNRTIAEFTTNDDGLNIILDDDQIIDIEIDWNEFIIR